MDDKIISLIEKAKLGDKTALIKLIKNEQDSIQTLLLHLKKDTNEINDITQDVLIKLSKKISQLKNPKLFKPWLYQIIANSYYDYLRKNKNKPLRYENLKNEDKINAQIPDYTTNPQDLILKMELDKIINDIMSALPKHYKTPILLREIEGMSYKDISQITKTSIGTVKSRIARAREILKKKITNYQNG